MKERRIIFRDTPKRRTLYVFDFDYSLVDSSERLSDSFVQNPNAMPQKNICDTVFLSICGITITDLKALESKDHETFLSVLKSLPVEAQTIYRNIRHGIHYTPQELISFFENSDPTEIIPLIRKDIASVMRKNLLICSSSKLPDLQRLRIRKVVGPDIPILIVRHISEKLSAIFKLAHSCGYTDIEFYEDNPRELSSKKERKQGVTAIQKIERLECQYQISMMLIQVSGAGTSSPCVGQIYSGR